MGIESLVTRLSGGSGNTDPTLSTGGAKSTLEVLFQNAVATTPIGGITLHNAAGNTVGSGTLKYYFAGKLATWTPPGDTLEGTAVAIGTNGTYLLRGTDVSDGYVIITVVSAGLSNAFDFSTAVTVTDWTALMLPAVSKDTALAGATEYFLYYLDNAGSTTIKVLSIQLQVDTPGLDTLSVAIISAKNTTETQGSAAGHSYSAVGVDVNLADMSAGDYWGIWLQRVIPAASVDGTINDTFKFLIKTLT